MQPRNIEATISELNQFETRTGGIGVWTAIEGVQALTTVTRNQSPLGALFPQVNGPQGVNFAIGSGLLVKGFINSHTGEIKLFPAKLFGYPERNI